MQRLWVALLVVVAGVCAAFAFRDAPRLWGHGHRVAAAVQPATPVLSVRRVAALVSQIAGDSRLRAGLDALVADPHASLQPNQFCLDVRQGGRHIYEQSPALQLIPASNMKLLSSYAALVKLGPSFTFTTALKASGPPQGGVVAGPVYLLGSGDPLLWTNDFAATYTKADLLPPSREPRVHTKLEDLADAVVRAGVKQIAGPIVGDDSRYDAVRAIPTWSPSYAATGEVGPVGALTVNEGFTAFAPRLIPAPDPAVAAAAALTSLLQARGVQVGGPPARATVPAAATAVVAQVVSPSLQDEVGELLRESENDAAEELVKELGVRFGGAGTTAAGLGVVKAVMDGAHLPAQAVMTDGSGLDRGDRLSCSLLDDLLQVAGPAGPLAAALPVAAKSGTLGKRLANTPAAGRVRAKTGSLTGVDTLSGFVEQVNGGTPLVFSFLLNSAPSDAVGRADADRVAQVLAAWPQAPPAAAISPLPPTGARP